LRRGHWAKAGFGCLLLLAGCGSLPQPFSGNPGATARRLAQPPPARLAVTPPTNAMLSDMGADTMAGALADALVAQEIPAVADAPRRGDWHVVLTADLRDGKVVPVFTVTDPAGKDEGASRGQPVDPRAWSDADPKTLRQVASNAAPGIAALLSSIQAARLASDPNSLVNRPARVYLKGVTGAPGDGDMALAAQIRQRLPALGEVVQDSPEKADFILAGDVKTAPGAGGTVRVEIQWIVTDAAGLERGRIVQINEVPAGTLDGMWGDVAYVVAQEAAGGVKDVILNGLGLRKPAQDGTAEPAAGAPADGAPVDGAPAKPGG
jgi:hypothetical protein